MSLSGVFLEGPMYMSGVQCVLGWAYDSDWCGVFLEESMSLSGVWCVPGVAYVSEWCVPGGSLCI